MIVVLVDENEIKIKYQGSIRIIEKLISWAPWHHIQVKYKQSKNFLNTSKTILTKASTTFDDTNRNKTVEAPSDNYLYKGVSVFKIKTNVLKHVLAAALKPTLPSF
jgi:phage terminase large subunit GpA-like protein